LEKYIIHSIIFEKENFFRKKWLQATVLHNHRSLVLTGKNYKVWEIKMRMLLHSQDVWDLVVHGYTKPTDHAVE
jgi:hypothetical protein